MSRHAVMAIPMAVTTVLMTAVVVMTGQWGPPAIMIGVVALAVLVPRLPTPDRTEDSDG